MPLIRFYYQGDLVTLGNAIKDDASRLYFLDTIANHQGLHWTTRDGRTAVKLYDPDIAIVEKHEAATRISCATVPQSEIVAKAIG
jgi:hypothetical protein